MPVSADVINPPKKTVVDFARKGKLHVIPGLSSYTVEEIRSLYFSKTELQEIKSTVLQRMATKQKQNHSLPLLWSCQKNLEDVGIACDEFDDLPQPPPSHPKEDDHHRGDHDDDDSLYGVLSMKQKRRRQRRIDEVLDRVLEQQFQEWERQERKSRHEALAAASAGPCRHDENPNHENQNEDRLMQLLARTSRQVTKKCQREAQRVASRLAAQVQSYQNEKLAAARFEIRVSNNTEAKNLMQQYQRHHRHANKQQMSRMQHQSKSESRRTPDRCSAEFPDEHRYDLPRHQRWRDHACRQFPAPGSHLHFHPTM